MANEVIDALLAELWGEDAGEIPEVEFGGPYGVGTWKDAVLMDVNTVEAHEYGYRAQLVFDLKGADGGMKYTGRINLPRTIEENGDHDLYERHLRREDRTRNNVAGLLLGADLLHGVVKNVDDDQYNKIISIFRHGVGRNMPIRVKVQQKFDKATETWVDTDFTEIVAIKARKK